MRMSFARLYSYSFIYSYRLGGFGFLPGSGFSVTVSGFYLYIHRGLLPHAGCIAC